MSYMRPMAFFWRWWEWARRPKLVLGMCRKCERMTVHQKHGVLRICMECGA
jgi:hypothetical protein